MNKQTKAEITALCADAVARTRAILLAPVVDPEAPAGYVRAEFAKAENDRRLRQLDVLVDELSATVEARHGIAYGALIRGHFDVLLAELLNA